MKPDCQQVLTQFASFSVEELSDAEAARLLQHLEECEPCKGQWLLFEKSLTIVTQSGPRDEDVEQHRSQQMWLVCLEHARKNRDKAALQNSDTETHESSAHESSTEAADASESRERAEKSVLVTPRVGLTLLGGALLFLASSYWFAPHPAPGAASTLPPMPTQLQSVGFKPLPRAAAPLVDYAATLGFDGLSDRVAPALFAAPVSRVAIQNESMP